MERSDGDLSPAECWDLLAMATVGRLALSIRALPMILPVRYVVDEDAVAISLGRLTMPTVSVHDAVVAFAVDRIDERTSAGWMVQVQGRARLGPAGPSSDGPDPADPVQVLRLAPGTVSGHRFTLQPFAPAP